MYRASLFAEHKPHQRERGNPGQEKFLISTSSDLHDVHAGLAELVGELFPDEEVEQLPGLGHHHLAARHIVKGLNKILQILNSEMLKNLIKVENRVDRQSMTCVKNNSTSNFCSLSGTQVRIQ